MTEIVYTAHARQRMILRGISEEMVSRALEMPEERSTGYRNRSLAYRRFPEGRIKVVYVQDQNRMTVITVMWED
ncbi:MAG: DUF4258 domain-containing protein [Thermodesulfobacteriota bacterium]